MGPSEAGDGPLDTARSDVTLASDDPVFVGAGDIHDTCADDEAEITAALLDGIAGTVFTIGDHVPNGTSDEFTNCYDSRWGRHKARTRPTAGDDEYTQAGAIPYFDYFGSAAGGPAGYYSFDLGDWHVISLNSNIASDSSSEQVAWLEADLAANPSACTLALWHHPRFSAGRATLDRKMRFIWKMLDQAGVDVVLNAHHHHYERFAPQDADGNADPEGIRSFIVGTGGKPLSSASNVQPNSEKIIATAFGVLELTLHPTGYSWKFVAEPGSLETDGGTASCVEIPADGTTNLPPTAATTGPYSGKEGSAISLSGSGSSDPEGQTLTYAWDFGDGTSGNGATVSHAYDDNGSYAVTLVVTDEGGLSDTTETAATIANVKPSATFNHPSSVPVNTGFTLSLTDPSDPSAADEAAGFKYRFDCGSGWSKLSTNPSRDCPGHSTTGTISVRGRIRDKDGGVRTYRRSVEITAS